MRKLNNGRGYDLDYYNLYLRHYLREHHFPEADEIFSLPVVPKLQLTYMWPRV